MADRYNSSSMIINQAISFRLAAIHRRIHLAEAAVGRPPGSVKLLAVSKTHATPKIRAAWTTGQHAFGESYLQEAMDKQMALANLDIEWHFIGRIQGNKIKAIAERFAWVHSLSDVNHALRLHKQRPASLPPLNVCLQVNVSGELTKNGVAPDMVSPLLKRCMDLPRLCVKGLMAIPEPVADPIQQHQPFAYLRCLRDTLARADFPLDTLSMGMSDDLEAAIAEGSTLVRVGTAIFGSRNHSE